MTLTKAHLVDRIHDATGISRPKSAKLIDSIFEIMKQTLEGGEDILISGFGKFCVKEKNSRRGRNSQTGNAALQNTVISSIPFLRATVGVSATLRRISGSLKS